MCKTGKYASVFPCFVIMAQPSNNKTKYPYSKIQVDSK